MVAELILGTAQLGLAYGRNRATSPGEKEAFAILAHANRLGVRMLDTARAYGVSEDRIGHYYQQSGATSPSPITKLDPLSALPDDATASEVARAVDNSVERSRRALCVDVLPVVMLHRAEHFRRWNGAAWSRLVEIKSRGDILKLGCSVQTRAELGSALELLDVSHIQLPYNVLDWRWDDCADLFPGTQITCHVRSVFLQGLLTPAPIERWPMLPGFDPGETILALRKATLEFERASVLDLCVGAVRGESWIDGLVIGVDTTAQLDETAALFSGSALSPEEIAHLRSILPKVPASLLDPSQWP